MTDGFAEQPAQGNISIGVGVHFKGELTVPGRAFVDGTFEGTLNAKALIVGKTGRVSGQISAETAEIQGWVGDHLKVRDHLLLRPTGCISGAIRYAKIVVEEGGEISGTLEKINPAQAETAHADQGSTVYQLQRQPEAS